MQYDDRLATVLRTGVRGEAAARTQYRQLLDLLGSLPADAGDDLVTQAYARLGELSDALPAAEQSQILRAPGLRLRNPALVAWLAQSEPQAAAAAMATADLPGDAWLSLIPQLPVTARGFLRHRRDLPQAARAVLSRLGVTDLVLPEPAQEQTVRGAESKQAEPSAAAGIGDLVRRIEAFQRARRDGTPPPPPPARLAPERPRADATLAGFDFATDAVGTIVWADTMAAPWLVGMTLAGSGPAALARLDPGSHGALRAHLPIRGGRLQLECGADLAGEWHIDAAPLFAMAGGAYQGHAGRLRRVQAAAPSPAAPEAGADRVRQVLHELRNPVNAIQGFAEIIQQQVFGPAPHEYRALAAGIAVDAARLMAGFDELDQLARLESGTRERVAGSCDLQQVVTQLLLRVDGVLRPRSARMVLRANGSSFTVDLAPDDARAMAWRLIATLAGAMAPGEVIELTVAADETSVSLTSELPAALVAQGDLFAASPPGQPRAISAGMFGNGFAFRLARAEAIAAGGSLERADDAVVVRLPALTPPGALHTLDSHG